MEVVDVAAMPWGPSMVPHRGGRMAHKRIFDGPLGSPDNFSFVLADEGKEYFSPRHRHPWDQIRYCLEGSIPIGRTDTVDEGEVAYFPEGVAYGPQEGGVDRVVLLLQFGGASGLGYLSVEQTDEGREALEEVGSFESGTFRRAAPAGGERANQDAYEAIWEHVTGEALTYPEGCYRAPIVVRPEAFPWEATTAEGVALRDLGRFPPRDVGLDVWRIDPGASLELGPVPDRRLAFVLGGSGECTGTSYVDQTAVRVDPGEMAAFTAGTRSEVFVITLPLLGS